MKCHELFEEIRKCKGFDKCWGITHPPPNPVVVPCLDKPEIMVVTEQRPSGKEFNLIEDIIKAKRGELTKGIIPKMEVFFRKGFLKNFDTEKRAFEKFYWTHYLKCPGNIRKRKRKGTDLKACAEKYLLKEINILCPKVVVTMGNQPSKWLLNKLGYPKDWNDRIWEEIQCVIQEKELQKFKINGREIQVVVMPHPSGINPLGHLLNNKISELFSEFTNS